MQSADPQVAINSRVGNTLPHFLIMTDESGRTLSLTEFFNLDQAAKPVVFLPVYYECSHLCPLIMIKMQASLSALKPLKPGYDYHLASISINPQETAQEAMAARISLLGDSQGFFDHWLFLTGDQKNTTMLTTALGFGIRTGLTDISHPVGVVIVNNENKIHRYLPGLDFNDFDLKLALVESGSKEKLGMSDHLLLSLFRYDTRSFEYKFNLVVLAGLILIIAAIGGFMILFWYAAKRNYYKKRRQKNAR